MSDDKSNEDRAAKLLADIETLAASRLDPAQVFDPAVTRSRVLGAVSAVAGGLRLAMADQARDDALRAAFLAGYDAGREVDVPGGYETDADADSRRQAALDAWLASGVPAKEGR